jgi:hypothetical protein
VRTRSFRGPAVSYFGSVTGTHSHREGSLGPPCCACHFLSEIDGVLPVRAFSAPGSQESGSFEFFGFGAVNSEPGSGTRRSRGSRRPPRSTRDRSRPGGPGTPPRRNSRGPCPRRCRRSRSTRRPASRRRAGRTSRGGEVVGQEHVVLRRLKSGGDVGAEPGDVRRGLSGEERGELLDRAGPPARGGNSASAVQNWRRAAASAAGRSFGSAAGFSGSAAPSPSCFRAASGSPSKRQNAAAAFGSVGFLSPRARKISASDEAAISATGRSIRPDSRWTVRRAASTATTAPSTGSWPPAPFRTSSFTF